MLSLIHVVEWRAAVTGDQIALSDHIGGELRYAELAVQTERSASAFAAAGIRPGDVVPILARNQVGWVTAMLGLLRLGALPAAVNWRFSPTEVTGLLAQMEAGARLPAIITDADCELLARQVVPGGDGPPLLRLTGENQIYAQQSSPMTVDRPVERLRGHEPCLLLHTSGTTGRPKLVPLTHQMLISAVTFMKLEVPEAVPGARHLSALPLFHVAGQANLAYSLFTGGHLHVLGGFEPAGFVDELASRRIQLTQLVPALIAAVTHEVLGRDEPPDMSQLTEVVYGASPIHPDLLELAVRTLGCRFRQNYASSETGPLPISSLSPDDHDPARGKLGTAGRPSLGWEVRLGEHGEIQVRGAAPLPGYWNDREATGKVMTADGFYRTGDVGAIDADGYLTIVDRLKDMIITGGENVFPAEVETVLASHPGVADVAVIGIPDATWGESVHAVVAPMPGAAQPSAAELVEWCRDRLAHFKCPRSVGFADQLPRNATGKILKSVLREPYWAGQDRRVS
ncbi:MAG: class I adenylate-forming enzyme family protein [Streptosporangiaceae bacterium]